MRGCCLRESDGSHLDFVGESEAKTEQTRVRAAAVAVGRCIGWGGRPGPYGAISCSMELARVIWLCQSLNRVTCDCATGYADSVSATATKVAHLNFEVCQSLCQTQNPLYIYNISTYSTSSSSNAALEQVEQHVHPRMCEAAACPPRQLPVAHLPHGVPIDVQHPPPPVPRASISGFALLL